MEGRVALVTGGGRGIGRAIAARLAKGSAKVAISYRANDAAAEETANLVREAGAECELFKGDVAAPKDVEFLVNGIGEAFGPVEILVNNAGTTRDNILLRLTDEDWDTVLDANLKGAFHTTKAVIKSMMKRRSGRVVNIIK